MDSQAAFSNNKISTTIPLKHAASFLSTYISFQEWSIPNSLIYLISKNPSTPKLYQKLIQSCKYFFIKNPILIVERLFLEYKDTVWRTYFNEKFVDLKNVSNKIWAIQKIENRGIFMDKIDEYFFSAIVIPKIYYQNDIKELHLWKQTISFNNLQFIASKCHVLWFNSVTVMYENGTVVQLEEIIKVLSSIKFFYYRFSFSSSSNNISFKTVQEMLKIPHFSNIDDFNLVNIPEEEFDIDTFYNYTKKNKKSNIFIDFSEQISEPFKIHLQNIVNELVETKNHDYKVPFIQFPGNDLPTCDKLFNLFNSKN